MKDKVIFEAKKVDISSFEGEIIISSRLSHKELTMEKRKGGKFHSSSSSTIKEVQPFHPQAWILVSNLSPSSSYLKSFF